MPKLKLDSFLLLIFFGLSIFLTFNRHSKSTYSDYHSVIWADKAGYYVYLPSFFIYDFKPTNFPKNIIQKTGEGFLFKHSNKKVFTKYTYGVAILQLPFFLFAHNLAEPFGFEKNGFSSIYHWAIMIASVVYLFLGLLFLKSFLQNYFTKNITYTILFFLFAGTNLYYYSIDEVGMSHIYSFFLFSMSLYYTRKYIYSKAPSLGNLILLSISSSLIVLVRPVNIIFLSTLFFLDIRNFDELIIRIKRILIDTRLIFAMLISFVLIFTPQMLYWYYLEGKPIIYTYEEESFSNWNHPEILKVWFSPNNGLFLYSPILLFSMIGIIIMLKNNVKNALFIGLLFLTISYSIGSWWSWHFGCGFGHRCFVEYFALLSLPFGYILNGVFQSKKMYFKGVFWSILIILLLYNFKMTYSYDGCWYKGDWDFNAFYDLLTSKTK